MQAIFLIFLLIPLATAFSADFSSEFFRPKAGETKYKTLERNFTLAKEEVRKEDFQFLGETQKMQCLMATFEKPNDLSSMGIVRIKKTTDYGDGPLFPPVTEDKIAFFFRAPSEVFPVFEDLALETNHEVLTIQLRKTPWFYSSPATLKIRRNGDFLFFSLTLQEDSQFPSLPNFGYCY